MLGQVVAQVGVVFHEQYVVGARLGGWTAVGRCEARLRLGLPEAQIGGGQVTHAQRQGEPERGPAFGRRLQAHVAPVHLGEVAHQRETQASAALGAATLHEAVEDARAVRLGHARPPVGHGDPRHAGVRLVAVVAHHLELDADRALGVMAQRVGDQVPQDRVDHRGVAPHLERVVAELQREARPAVGREGVEALHDAAQQGLEVYFARLQARGAGARARQLEEVVDQLLEVLRVAMGQLDARRGNAAKGRRLGQIAQRTEDEGERRAELMGHLGQEAPLDGVGFQQSARLSRQALVLGPERLVGDLELARLRRDALGQGAALQTALEQGALLVLQPARGQQPAHAPGDPGEGVEHRRPPGQGALGRQPAQRGQVAREHHAHERRREGELQAEQRQERGADQQPAQDGAVVLEDERAQQGHDQVRLNEGERDQPRDAPVPVRARRCPDQEREHRRVEEGEDQPEMRDVLPPDQRDGGQRHEPAPEHRDRARSTVVRGALDAVGLEFVLGRPIEEAERPRMPLDAGDLAPHPRTMNRSAWTGQHVSLPVEGCATYDTPRAPKGVSHRFTGLRAGLLSRRLARDVAAWSAGAGRDVHGGVVNAAHDSAEFARHAVQVVRNATVDTAGDVTVAFESAALDTRVALHRAGNALVITAEAAAGTTRAFVEGTGQQIREVYWRTSTDISDAFTDAAQDVAAFGANLGGTVEAAVNDAVNAVNHARGVVGGAANGAVNAVVDFFDGLF